MRLLADAMSRFLPPLCLSLALAAAAHSVSWLIAGDALDSPAAASAATTQLRREGTQLRDEPGRMIAAGGQITFRAADGASYISLQNLNLQRVGAIILGSPDSVEWLISGTVTEYQGSNYLLITRARRRMPKAQTPRDF